MRLILGALALGILGSGTAAAQRRSRPHRSGLWGEVSSGLGHVRIACSGCNDVVSANAPTSFVRIGGTVSDHVVIGFEAFSLLGRGFGVFSQDSTATTETATAAIVVLWFPGRHGLFFKGGVGAAGGQFILPSSPTQSDTSNGAGIGVTFGLGWDWSISRKFAISANVGTFVIGVGDIVLPTRRVDDVIATMYQASIGFTFR
jgi:hypothetical protein